jgi:hypothetical protein
MASLLKTVFDDALIRHAGSHPRLRQRVEVVPSNDGFVPPVGPGEAISPYLR